MTALEVVGARIQQSVNSVEDEGLSLIECTHMLDVVIAALTAEGYTICESRIGREGMTMVPVQLSSRIEV